MAKKLKHDCNFVLCFFFHFPSVRSFAAHKKALFLDPMSVGRVAMRPGLIDENNESVIEGNFSSEHCEREVFFCCNKLCNLLENCFIKSWSQRHKKSAVCALNCYGASNH